jgi:hypothetical protein
VSAWLLAIYLVTLIQAAIHVGHTAAQWLRATPMSFVNFAWPIARGVLLHQLIGASIAAILGVILGLQPLLAVYLLMLWLAVVASLLCVSLADSFCHRSSGWKLLTAALTTAIIEQRHHGWSLPALAAVGAWHVHRALRFHPVRS